MSPGALGTPEAGAEAAATARPPGGEPAVARPADGGLAKAQYADAGAWTGMMRPTSIRQMRSAFRSALADRRDERRAIGRAVRRALYDHRAHVIESLRTVLRANVPEARPAGRASQSSETSDPLPIRVLHIIQNHPEGVRALDVGNALGVDWRRVLGITRKLAEAGLVEQVDQDFYAIRKASRRW